MLEVIMSRIYLNLNMQVKTNPLIIQTQENNRRKIGCGKMVIT